MKNLFRKKYVWVITAVLFLIIVIGVNAARNGQKFTEEGRVQKQEVKQSVTATGKVTSETDLNLSFKNSGTVTRVNASVGDKARRGQVVASLDQRDASAAIAQASASVLAARANYDKLVNGASNPEIELARAAVTAAQVALDNAKNAQKTTEEQQKSLVASAYSAMLNAGLAAIPDNSNASGITATITGTYTGTAEGQSKMRINEAITPTYNISGVINAIGQFSRGIPLPLGSSGLYVTFSQTGTYSWSDTWTISIPNTQSSSYLTAYNAYQSALQAQAQANVAAKGSVDTAQASLDQAKASLALKQSMARPEDLSAAQAQIQSAQAQLQVAQNQYANNQIVAPIDGTITKLDLKLGETVAAQTVVVTMLDQEELHVESYISESSISHLKVGQSVEMTLDAFGSDKILRGEVISIDPAATIVSGVINYRVISSIPQEADLKPGMTVNLTINIDEKSDVLAVPNRLIKNVNGGKVVYILVDKKPVEKEVTIGLVGDQFTEVLSGLNGGEILITISEE